MRSFTKKNVPYNESIYHLLYDNGAEFKKLREYLLDDSKDPDAIKFKNAAKNLITLFVGSTKEIDKIKEYYKVDVSAIDELAKPNYKPVLFEKPKVVNPEELTPDEEKAQKASVLWNLDQLNPTPTEIEEKLKGLKIISVPDAEKLGQLLALRELLRFARIRAGYENLYGYIQKSTIKNGGKTTEETEVKLNQLKYGNKSTPKNSSQFGHINADRLNEIDINENGKISRYKLVGEDEKKVNLRDGDSDHFFLVDFKTAKDFISTYIDEIVDTREHNGKQVLAYLDAHTAKSTHGYGKAKYSLIRSHGLYCAFCESPLVDASTSDIEHKLPKSMFPSDSLNWENLVLACINCNRTHKGTKFANSRFKNYFDSFCYSIGQNYVPILKSGGLSDPLTSKVSFPTLSNRQVLDSPNTYNYKSHTFSRITATFQAIFSVAKIAGDRSGGQNASFDLVLESAQAAALYYRDFIGAKGLKNNSLEDRVASYSKYYSITPMDTDEAKVELITKALVVAGSYASGDPDKIGRTDNDAHFKANYSNFSVEIRSEIENISKKYGKTADGRKSLEEEKLMALTKKVAQKIAVQNTQDSGYNKMIMNSIEAVAWPDLKLKNIGVAFQCYDYKSDLDIAVDDVLDYHFVCYLNSHDEYEARLKTENDEIRNDSGKSVTSDVMGGSIKPLISQKAINLRDICGLNSGSTSSPWIDQRVLRRKKTWFHAIKQLHHLKSYKTEYETLSTYYETQLDPAKFGSESDIKEFKSGVTEYATGAKESQDWKDNRDNLSKKLTDADGFLRESIWKNITSMVKDGGFYSTWVRTFQNYCDPKDPIDRSAGNPNLEINERHDLELVRRLEIESQSNPGDPFQFHGTDAKEILDLLNPKD